MPGSHFHDRVIPKIKTLDTVNMQNFIQRLAREHGFLDSLLNTIHEGIIVTDETRKIIYHNAAAKALLGLPDDYSNLTIQKILKGVDWDSLIDPEEDCSVRCMRQDLEIFYPEHRIIQLYAMPMDQNKGQYAVILHDITLTLEKASEAAESERSKMVSMLAAGVAHEIGNPLNSLYLHLQFLQKMMTMPDFDPEDARQELKESRDEVERLDAIINQFLKAIRPGKPNLQRTDLKNVVLESLNFMRHEIASREVKLDFFWGDNVPLIFADAGQLKQAVYNLVKNAIQAMSMGGKLGIRCAADDLFVRLSVSDSGCGIPKENLTRIFSPYYTTKNGGNGLGLMIVDRIIREHGGSLSVDSEEGKGTTFTIRFPRAERPVRVLPAPKTEGRDDE